MTRPPGAPDMVTLSIAAALDALSPRFAGDERWEQAAADWAIFAAHGCAGGACGRQTLLTLARIADGDPGLSLGMSPEEFGAERGFYVSFTPARLDRWPRLRRLLGMPASRPPVYGRTELEALEGVLWMAVDFPSRRE